MSEIQSENHRKTDIKSMDLAELKAFMTSIGEKPFRASQIYQWMHVRHVSSWDEMTNLSKALREKLKEQLTGPFTEYYTRTPVTWVYIQY